MTDLTTMDTNNYAAMAKLMGVANEKPSSGGNSLARLRISHAPIMGSAEVNGKKVNVEVVEGGAYKLEIPDGPTYYASSIQVRTFMQRFMYKRYVQGTNGESNRFIKSLMTDDAKMEYDLKDNDGGFNCGKPAGYIKDFKALPEKTQALLKAIKRVRAIFGEVTMINPTNEKGESVDVPTTSFIWEVDNRDAYKEMGTCYATLAKMQRLPTQHMVTLTSDERKIPTGASYFVPVSSVNLAESLDMTKDDQSLFSDFVSWVDNYNNYVLKSWTDKAVDKMDDDDVDVIDDIVDIEIEDEVA